MTDGNEHAPGCDATGCDMSVVSTRGLYAFVDYR